MLAVRPVFWDAIMNILFVEDDPELARQVGASLKAAGHTHHLCECAGDALRHLEANSCDLMILDVGLPDMDGLQLVERLRAAGHLQPVLFLTARASVTDRVRGLAAGGDDYLTKPFAAEEMLARVEALHRRASQSATPTAKKIGRWTLDATLRRLRDGEECVELQPREWTLLEVLQQHEGRTLTKKFLLEKVWDIRFDPGTNVVDAMICRLRRKLDTPGAQSHIQTIRGKGYVFQAVP
jgi:DNA-binding response OmpR family regulator